MQSRLFSLAERLCYHQSGKKKKIILWMNWNTIYSLNIVYTFKSELILVWVQLAGADLCRDLLCIRVSHQRTSNKTIQNYSYGLCSFTLSRINLLTDWVMKRYYLPIPQVLQQNDVSKSLKTHPTEIPSATSKEHTCQKYSSIFNKKKSLARITDQVSFTPAVRRWCSWLKCRPLRQCQVS